MLDPPSVLLDEPFGALDPITRRELQREFRDLAADGSRTFVFVTHDLDEAFALGDRVALLWEACQLPDYRKIAPAQHTEIVGQLFGHLVDRGTVPDDWMAENLKNCDRVEGDIDTLSARIAQVRTWTFVANRNAWLDDPLHWQERTRALEDRLSDALHEKLTQRFVDRRTSVLMRRLREKVMLDAVIASDGDVQVEGQHVGWLAGFRFTPDTTTEELDGKAVRAAAQKALAAEIQRRAEKLSLADDTAFVLDSEGAIRWTGEVVAKMASGDDILKPKVLLLADEHLTGGARETVDGRLAKWLNDQIEKHLGSLIALRAGDGLEGTARGIGFQLAEELGHLDRRQVAGEVKGLDQDARATLRKHGVRFGAYALFVPQLLKPAPASLLSILWALRNGGTDQPGLQHVPQMNASGRTSIPVDPEVNAQLYPIAGFRVCGRRAVRFDILERLADLIRPLIAFRAEDSEGDAPEGAAQGNGFMVTVEMTSLLGCAGEDFSEVLKSLGYRVERKTIPIEEKVDEAEAKPAESQGVDADAPGQMETPAAETDTQNAMDADTDGTSPTGPNSDPVVGTAESSEEAGTQAADALSTTAATENAETSLDASIGEETAEEPTEQVIEIWRPGQNRPRQQGNRPNRRQTQQNGEARRADGDGRKSRVPNKRGDQRGKGKKGGKPSAPRSFSSGPPKKDRKADPDSPFAALAGLFDGPDGKN